MSCLELNAFESCFEKPLEINNNWLIWWRGSSNHETILVNWIFFRHESIIVKNNVWQINFMTINLSMDLETCFFFLLPFFYKILHSLLWIKFILTSSLNFRCYNLHLNRPVTEQKKYCISLNSFRRGWNMKIFSYNFRNKLFF